MTQGMTPSELVAAGEAVFGRRWIRPMARALGQDHRSVRYWKAGERPIPAAAAEKIRSLHRIGPVGMSFKLPPLGAISRNKRLFNPEPAASLRVEGRIGFCLSTRMQRGEK